MGTVLNIHVEPEDKDVVTSAINAATQYIWLEMYLLEDPAVITALSNAAQRKAGQGLIDVRVILEPNPDFALAPTDPSSPAQALKNSQVQVRYRPPQAVLPFPPGSTFNPVSHAKVQQDSVQRVFGPLSGHACQDDAG